VTPPIRAFRGSMGNWRPTPSALLALGLRSCTDIPALKELEEWFDALASKQEPVPQSLDSYFARTKNLQSRRRARELERRETVIGSQQQG
jgi:hypothetical protein